MNEYKIQAETIYGPVMYTVIYGDQLAIEGLRASSERLSATMFKLTYGTEANEAERYFDRHKANIRYRLEAVPFLKEVPAQFLDVRVGLGAPVAIGAGPADREGDEAGRRVAFWQQYPKLQPALFLQAETANAALQRLAGNAKVWDRTPPDILAALEPWVLTLFGIVPPGSVQLVWEILGRLGTPSAADRMLRELERKGTHPQGKAIVNGLRHCFDPDRDADRLLALNKRKVYRKDLARPYLHLVAGVRSDRAVSTARDILFQQVDAAPEALRVFKRNEVADPIGMLHEGFWATDTVWVVFRYVELLWDLAPKDRSISLAEANRKLAEKQFTDTAPVTWHQQLYQVWKGLLVQTDTAERWRIIETYTERREARLQYNALLQLNFVIRQYPDDVPTEKILRRLHWQVSHRYDKVSAQAIAALRKLLPHMPDRLGLNERLMPVSTAPGLRVAKLKLLRMLGEDPDIAAAQSAYFQEFLERDLLPDERLVARSIVKYLRLEV